MHTAKLKLAVGIAASIGAIALVGVGTVAAWPGEETPAATAPLELREAAAPVPALKPEPPLEGDFLNSESAPPSAFPDLNPPRWNGQTRVVWMNDACPHLYKEGGIKIEATDDTYRRLLKSSLYHASIEMHKMWILFDAGSYNPSELHQQLGVLDKMRETTQLLWQNEAKELIPRLKEFVVLAKEYERFTIPRVDAGTDLPQNRHEVWRHRLATEAALWKALHPPAAKK